MAFHSFDYVACFLPVTLLGYLLLRRARLCNLWLLGCSIYFYAVGNWWWVAPFFVSAIFDYWMGLRMEAAQGVRLRRQLIALSCVLNLGLLSIFKYTTWVSSEVSVLASMFGIALTPLIVPLPAGISFYTFQSMSYTIDIYRKELRASHNIVDYLCFVAFFPQLIAGPIMRARDLLPQISRQQDLATATNVEQGLFMILFGLFLKMVLADNFGGLVDSIAQVMRTRNALPPGLGLIFAYAFAGQIYCDFAAYSIIAWGSAKLFNIELMQNFATPYFATNPSDFWRRWHISLSTWLRDYLYIALGGNRYGVPRTLVNLMLTMVLGGIWHGASIMFIYWGLWHGALLILYRIAPLDRWLMAGFGHWLGRKLAIVLMFHLVCFGWILFRASTAEFPLVWASVMALPQVVETPWPALVPYWDMVRAGQLGFLPVLMGSVQHILTSNWLFMVFGWGAILFGFALFIVDYLGYRAGGDFTDRYARMAVVTRATTILLLIYALIFFGRRQANEFIYFAF